MVGENREPKHRMNDWLRFLGIVLYLFSNCFLMVEPQQRHLPACHRIFGLSPGRWRWRLGHMATRMKPHSPELSLLLRIRSNRSDESNTSQYSTILRKIREHLRDGVKQTVRGAAFQARLNDDDEDGLVNGTYECALRMALIWRCGWVPIVHRTEIELAER